jgi:hypothetical protein
MRSFLALVGDAWREARDKRVVWVLSFIGLALVLFFASFRFSPPDADRALIAAVDGLDEIPRHFSRFGPGRRPDPAVRHQASAPRAPQPDDDLPLGVAGMRVVEVEFADAVHVDELCRAWRRAQSEGPRRVARQDRDALRADDQSPVTSDQRRGYFEERLREAGFDPVIVRTVGDDDRRYRLAAGVERPLELRHSAKVELLFGAFAVPLDDQSPAEFLLALEAGVARGFSGFLGLVILLGAFASVMPDLLQKGRLDLVLARPIGRAQLVLYKFAGVLLFVTCLWVTLFTACCAALGASSGWWSFKLVGCALTNTLVFAAIFPVTMVVGALTRHTSLASLAGLLAWALEGIVTSVKEAMEAGAFGDVGKWRKAVDLVAWVLPKNAELATLNQRLLAHEFLSPAAAARLLGETVDVDWWYAGGTTALFAGTFVALTCLYVARRDW